MDIKLIRIVPGLEYLNHSTFQHLEQQAIKLADAIFKRAQRTLNKIDTITIEYEFFPDKEGRFQRNAYILIRVKMFKKKAENQVDIFLSNLGYKIEKDSPPQNIHENLFAKEVLEYLEPELSVS